VSALALVMTPALSGAQTLPPGKPAGVAQAQMDNHQLFIYLTVGGTLVTVVGAFLLVKNKNGSGNAATGTTTS
jgi:hypothetical protein